MKIEIEVVDGIVRFCDDYKAFLADREGVDSAKELLEKLVKEGFPAMLEGRRLKAEEICEKYGIEA